MHTIRFSILAILTGWTFSVAVSSASLATPSCFARPGDESHCLDNPASIAIGEEYFVFGESYDLFGDQGADHYWGARAVAGIYDAEGGLLRTVTSDGMPSARFLPTLVHDGRYVYVLFGKVEADWASGHYSTKFADVGGFYDLETDVWSSFPAAGSPPTPVDETGGGSPRDGGGPTRCGQLNRTYSAAVKSLSELRICYTNVPCSRRGDQAAGRWCHDFNRAGNTWFVHRENQRSIAVVGGVGQTAPATSTLPVELKFQVSDPFATTLAGIPVTLYTQSFRFGQPFGTMSKFLVETDAQGIVAAEWTLGSFVGTQWAGASVGVDDEGSERARVDVSATATPASP